MANYYSFERVEDQGSVHYVFATDFGIVYSVYFNPPDFSDYIENLPHLSKHGRLFGFFPVDEESEKKSDPQVSNTVCRIIEDYFGSYGNDHVLLYHCDSDDDRQGCRFRLFKLWARNASHIVDIYTGGKQVEIDRPDGTKKHEYIGFIVAGEKNKALNTIQEEFIEISAFLIDHKR